MTKTFVVVITDEDLVVRVWGPETYSNCLDRVTDFIQRGPVKWERDTDDGTDSWISHGSAGCTVMEIVYLRPLESLDEVTIP